MNPVIVESIDHEGRGIAHAGGKVIFIDGAVTGERVTYSSYRKKDNFELAQLGQIMEPSFMRVVPKCRHFGVCGGCSMQHMEVMAQVAAKQRVLEDNLERIGRAKPERILAPIYGQAWGYRQRARLSVRHVLKKGRTLVGFHERRGRYVADMQACCILPPKISNLLPELARMIDGLSIRDALPQVEVAIGDAVDVLVLRILRALTPSDEVTIREFADGHQVQIWLQPKGPDSAAPFHPLDAPPLSYSLPEFNIVMPYAPTEFTQVNSAMNRLMVSRALRLLKPKAHERIADFFCGLGNFTLPIARSGARVVGIEGSDALVRRAVQNAAHNGLSANTEFHSMNLFEADPAALMKFRRFDKWLIDPPRDGAVELLKSISPEVAPRRIVYVSCNPTTLARDAAVLTQAQGYLLKSAGAMNMFPHTSHVESIAVFEK